MGMCPYTTDVAVWNISKMRRQVYQTPKSYLSFIAACKIMYKTKKEIEHKEASILLGLEKLEQAKDAEDMKVVLAEEIKN